MTNQNRLLPKPVYEILPALYIATGLVGIFIISSKLAVTAGLVLILIGGLIIVQRRNYRSAKQAINQNRQEKV